MDFLKVLFFTFIVIFFAFCRNHQQEGNTIFQKIWKLEAELKVVGAVDPDKSEKLIDQLIRIRDSINDPGAVVNLYAQLSEIYQYQKKNNVKALELITEVVRICAKNPGISLTSPYLFIDAGNILYNYGLYENAASVYQNTAKFALEQHAIFPAITAYHNAGLAWQYCNEPDSAINCFNLAYKLMPNRNELLIVKNRVYISNIYLLKQWNDSVAACIRKSDQVLASFSRDSLEGNRLRNQNLRYTYHQAQAKLAILKAGLFSREGDFEKVGPMYIRAIDEAVQSGQEELVYTAKYNYAAFALKQLLPEFESLADSAGVLANRLNDWQYHMDMAKLWTIHYGMTGNGTRLQYWNRKMEQASDSLTKFRTDEGIKKSLVQVYAADLVLTVNSLILSQEKNKKIIFRQRIVMGLTTVLLILVVTASGIVIYRNSRKISELLVSVSNTIYKSKISSPSLETLDQLSKRLEELMRNQKKYLDPDISLKQLAFLLNTNTTYLSQVINQEFNKNFNDFINELRVKEACRLIETGQFHLQTLEAIGNEVGFNSKSVFFTLFKKFTGMSPSAYRKTFQDRAN